MTGTAVLLDVETTGLDPDQNEIIELAMQSFTYDPETGAVVELGPSYQGFQEPKYPLSAEIEKLTGITQDQVKGHQIEWLAAEEMLARSDLVISHNARFDRGFIDLQSSVSQDKIWGCSLRQVAWGTKGFAEKSLSALCQSHGIEFQAHRAIYDVKALLGLLQKPCPQTQKPYLAEILEGARTEVSQIVAGGKTYDRRELLKTQGFRWNPTKKCWAKIVPREGEEAMIAWLNSQPGLGLGEVRHLALQDRFKREFEG